MGFELDHFMLFVSDKTAATAALTRAGLTAGYEGLQPGTGAGHTIYFFDNTYLELVWPAPGRVPFEDTPRMHIAERCAGGGWCAFGVSVRPIGAAGELAIPTWDYPAPFLPPGAVPIPIGVNSEVPGEPLIVVSLVSGRPDGRRVKPVLQDDLREVTSAGIRLSASGSYTSALTALADVAPITAEPGESDALVLTFDGGVKGVVKDLRPHLPLVLAT